MTEAELLQKIAEKQSIDSRVASAIVAFEIILTHGASEHLPANFPHTVLNMAKSSLLRMEIRQAQFKLDKTYTDRSKQKIEQAYDYIESKRLET